MTIWPTRKFNVCVLQVALETLEGHQRAIMGSMTVEVIFFFFFSFFLLLHNIFHNLFRKSTETERSFRRGCLRLPALILLTWELLWYPTHWRISEMTRDTWRFTRMQIVFNSTWQWIWIPGSGTCKDSGSQERCKNWRSGSAKRCHNKRGHCWGGTDGI